MRRYFEALALNSAGLPDAQTVYEAAGIDRKTAAAYDFLLANLLVTDTVPAWVSNRLSRLMKRRKRYLVDPSPVAAALRFDQASAAPTAADARHLAWLRDRLGARFLAGAVLHTGPRPFQLAERIFALPICALWA